MGKERGKLFGSLLSVAALIVVGADVSAQQANELTSSEITEVKGRFVFQVPEESVQTKSDVQRVTEEEKNLLSWARQNLSSPLVYSPIERRPEVSLMVFQKNSNIQAHLRLSNLLRFRGHKVKVTLHRIQRGVEAAVDAFLGQKEGSSLVKFATLEEFSEPAKLTVVQVQEALVSQLSSAYFLFDGLSASSEYAAEVSFPDGESNHLPQYLTFDTINPSLFEVLELNATASTVNFRITSAKLRDFLEKEKDIQVLAGVRKHSLGEKKYP